MGADISAYTASHVPEWQLVYHAASPAAYQSACRFLYEVLTHPAVRKRRVPVLLACNKADHGAKAHTVDFIRKRLEKEM